MAEKRVIALGFFDGVHIGHAALLRTAVGRARMLGVESAALTFDRSPREAVTGTAVPLLTDTAERGALMRERYGVEHVLVARFDCALRETPWETFLSETLIGQYRAVHLVAGHDFRFGRGGEGTSERLRAWCAARGVGCDVIPAVTLDGVVVSATHIRTLIEAGDVERAAAFLGRPYLLTGTVMHGEGLGTTALYPTANLLPSPWRVLPRFGVYATRVCLPDGHDYPGVTNIGVRPTATSNGNVSIETYLIGFKGDLYGAPLRVALLRFLRPERKFDTLSALREQIKRDVKQTETCTEIMRCCSS